MNGFGGWHLQIWQTIKYMSFKKAPYTGKNVIKVWKISRNNKDPFVLIAKHFFYDSVTTAGQVFSSETGFQQKVQLHQTQNV